MEILYDKIEIDKQITRLAGQIDDDRDLGTNPIIICVLNGAFIFCSDLVRKLHIEPELDFIRLKSYAGHETSGEVKITAQTERDGTKLYGRSILIVEDIVDTGITLSWLIAELGLFSPKCVKIASLLWKPTRTIKPLKINHLGFICPDVFVVGYGLDDDGKYRHLPELYYLP